MPPAARFSLDPVPDRRPLSLSAAMARRARTTRPRHHRVRPREAAGGEDRLSALPDDLLHLILRRLDTRTALSTSVLARRWARLPRVLPALDFRVREILPQRYHRALALRRRTLGQGGAAAEELDALIARYERRAMRAFAGGVTSLLEADGGDDDDGHGDNDGYANRRAKSLRLEFFPTHNAGCVDRLITAAVGTWGVDDLEVVVKPAPCYHHHAPAYSFPHHCIDDEPHRSRLRSLTLGNCTLPPLHMYSALTTLVLQDMPSSTPVAVYQRVFNDCTQVQVLHLKSCRCTQNRRLVVDAPRSGIGELVVEDCSFLMIEVRALPMLNRLACLSNTVKLRFGSVPRLTHINLTFSAEHEGNLLQSQHRQLGWLLGNVPALMKLVVRFAGPRRSFVLGNLDTPLRDLKMLLVADVPSYWEASWPRLLLQAAPSLEVLHIHVALSEENHLMMWQQPKLRHRQLKELVMVGFRQTWRQIRFLRYIVKACKSLQRVILLKDGCVGDKGLWDWEIVVPQECPWSEQDKMVVGRQIKYGRSWSKPHVQVILG